MYLENRGSERHAADGTIQDAQLHSDYLLHVNDNLILVIFSFILHNLQNP